MLFRSPGNKSVLRMPKKRALLRWGSDLKELTKKTDEKSGRKWQRWRILLNFGLKEKQQVKGLFLSCLYA